MANRAIELVTQVKSWYSELAGKADSDGLRLPQ
jgi:hypothetical protein